MILQHRPTQCLAEGSERDEEKKRITIQRKIAKMRQRDKELEKGSVFLRFKDIKKEKECEIDR